MFSKPKSQILSKVGSQASKKPSVFSQKSAKAPSVAASGWKEETKNIEEEPVAVDEYAAAADENLAVEAPAEEAPVDLDEAEDIITSVSQIKPTASQISKMSGKTYIS